MPKILITGITGFLGSHIAEILCQNDIEVIGLKRASSDTWRCREFEDRIDWVDLDDLNDWKGIVLQKNPECIVHGAWIGVEAKDRDNWVEQAKNIKLLMDMLDLSISLRIKKFVFLGSQAEYGMVEGLVKENFAVNPFSAYGGIKLASLELLKAYAQQYDINWLWLRIFSVFGERESQSWLIPSIIKTMQEKSEMDFTPGEQRYAYLYAKDFAKIVLSLLLKDVDSGIYNVSANVATRLRSLIESIRDQINPEFMLNFGAIPYRSNQSMHIQGDTAKLFNEIGSFEFTDFNVALSNTLKYYTSSQHS